MLNTFTFITSMHGPLYQNTVRDACSVSPVRTVRGGPLRYILAKSRSFSRHVPRIRKDKRHISWPTSLFAFGVVKTQVSGGKSRRFQRCLRGGCFVAGMLRLTRGSQVRLAGRGGCRGLWAQWFGAIQVRVCACVFGVCVSEWCVSVCVCAMIRAHLKPRNF